MTKYDELCEVAVSNYGLVTAKMIDALGIHLKDVLEWVKSGRIEKRGRGVYRITHYLPTEYDAYAEAVALVGDTAMICGESVLAMHNLALVNPARVHVAVRQHLRDDDIGHRPRKAHGILSSGQRPDGLDQIDTRQRPFHIEKSFFNASYSKTSNNPRVPASRTAEASRSVRIFPRNRRMTSASF